MFNQLKGNTMHQDEWDNEHLGRFLKSFVVATGVILAGMTLYFLAEMLKLFAA